jgi:hypothetical protein
MLPLVHVGTLMQIGMLPQRCWYATPMQVGMLPQRRLVCYSNLVVEVLQKDVQSYKDDNERLMRAKEQQDDFNVKLMQSLDIIEKKMDKETEFE